MGRILAITMAFTLVIMPLAVYGQSEDTTSNPSPPVSQQLIPEGDFALKLISALNLGTPTTEAQAEDLLSSVGIAPNNGWISDYPMTPIIIGEVEGAVAAAADANKLPMGKDDALKAFEGLKIEFGLAVVSGSPGQYAESQPQPDSAMINSYYYNEGPPVVTYYPPPWDYYYLYDWVPYPFWCSGFYFPGFFVLSDFSFVAVVGHHHHHHHLVSNHFVNPTTHAVSTVDPATRTSGRSVSASPSRNRGFTSLDARRGATSIFNRGFERGRSPSTVAPMGRNVGSQRNWGQSEGRTSPNAGNRGQGFTGRSEGWSGRSGMSASPPSRSFSAPSRGSFEGVSRGGFSGGHTVEVPAGHSSGGLSGTRSFSGGGFHSGGGGRR
jgi:hypothetical protein